MDTIRNMLGSGSKNNEDSSVSGEGSHLARSSNTDSEGLGSRVPGAFPGSGRSDERGLTGYGDDDTSRTGGGLTGSSGGYGDNATSRLDDTGISRGVAGDTSSSGIGASDTSRAGGGLTAPSGSDNTSSGITAGDSSYTGSSYTGGRGYDNTSSGIGATDASRPGGGLGAASGYDKNTSRIDDTDTSRTGGGLTGSTGYGSTTSRLDDTDTSRTGGLTGSSGYGSNTSRLGDTDTSRTGGLTGSTGYGSNTSRLDDTDTSRTGGLTGSSGYGSTTSRLDDTSRTGGLTGSSGIGGTSDTTRGYATTDRDTPSTIRDDSSGAVGNTYTERKYPLSSGSDGRDIPGSKYDSHGPHHTETANRLDPNVSGSGLGTSSTGTDTYGSRRDDDTSGSRTGYAAGGAAAGTAGGASGASEYGSSRRDDDTTLGDDRHGSKKGGLAGGVAGIAAGGSSAKDYTTKNDDLGPAENTAGPYKSDTFNKADPRVEENPQKARDILMDVKKNERGEEQLIVSGAGVDRDHTVSEERRTDKENRDDEYDPESKKKSTGSKILGAFGIGKDKDNKKANDDTFDSSRGARASDYTSSRDNERSAYGSTTTTSDTYGSRGDTDKYEKRTEPTSHGRRDDTEDLSTRRDRDFDDDDASGEKKRGGLSGLLHRDHPNKLHKDPPEGHRSKADTDDAFGSRGHATGGPHYGIDGEIGRSNEVSGYGGGDARETRNIDDINRESGTRDY